MLPPDEKVCDRCGLVYRRSDLPNRQSNKHWAKRRFCSAECQSSWLGEFGATLRGEKHPGWKGDDATHQAGRKRARALYPDAKPCEVCGKPGERHHRDGNPLNNAPENIGWLCRTHHIRTEDRMSYRRLQDADMAAREERRRAQARERQRRYQARKRGQA